MLRVPLEHPLPALFHVRYHSRETGIKGVEGILNEHEMHEVEYIGIWHECVAIRVRSLLYEPKNCKWVYQIESRLGSKIEDDVMYWAYEAKCCH